MKLNTYQYGEVEFTDENVINFKEGLLGFEDLKNYLLIKPDDNLFYWLTSIDDPGIAFPLFGARVVDDTFPQEENYEAFGIVILNPDPLKITINLKAPVYICQDKREGFQKIIDTEKYPVHYNLFTE